MTREPNNILIGAFVAGAMILVIVAILFFGSNSFFQKKNLFVLHFKGSVKGLSVGSPVVLRGVKIGLVKDIRINAISDSTSDRHNFSILVIIEIGKDLVIGSESSVEDNVKRLIDQGLRAQIEIQSMVTGQLLVGLDFHPEKPAKLSGQSSDYLEIPTIQTEIEELTQKIKQVPIEEMFNKLFSIISSVEVSLNPDAIGQLLNSLSLALKSLNKISNSLDDHLPVIAADMEETIKSAKILMQNSNNQVLTLGVSLNQTIVDLQELIVTTKVNIESAGTSINGAVKNADQLLTNITNEVPPISSSIKGTLTTAKESLNGVKETLNSAKETLNAAKGASNQATTMFKGVDRITANDSILINNLNTTLDDLSDTARSLRLLAEYLERHPEALLQGKQ